MRLREMIKKTCEYESNNWNFVLADTPNLIYGVYKGELILRRRIHESSDK